jgi:hypothetical protein
MTPAAPPLAQGVAYHTPLHLPLHLDPRRRDMEQFEAMWGFQVNTDSPRCQWDLDLIDRLDFAHKIFRSLVHVMMYRSQTEITVSTCATRGMRALFPTEPLITAGRPSPSLNSPN